MAARHVRAPGESGSARRPWRGLTRTLAGVASGRSVWRSIAPSHGSPAKAHSARSSASGSVTSASYRTSW
jgi:hypothetical protein